MARHIATNFTGGLQFPYADAGTDIFSKGDIQILAQAVDQHTHAAGLGLPIAPGAIPNGSITSAMIVDGTIATVDIAANAVTQKIGTYLATPTFSSTTTNTWLATPATVSVTSQGGPLCVEWLVSLSHSAPSAQILFQPVVDGAVSGALGQATTSPVALASLAVTGTAYVQPSVGVHTIALYVFNSGVGTLANTPGITWSLHVTELKR